MMPNICGRHVQRDWFLDYASYVILERAVPAIKDGLEMPVRNVESCMH